MPRISPPCPPPADTAERLLDTAERLFGLHGYDGVGLRALADEAKVNLGAVTYHFGSKEKLYIETFLRRLRPANAERLQLLAEARNKLKGKPPGLEAIVECMFKPIYTRGQREPAFARFLSRNLFTAPSFLKQALRTEMMEVSAAFHAALAAAVPDQPEDLVYLREVFAAGTMLMVSMMMTEVRTVHGLQYDEVVLKEVIRFVSAGFKSAPAVPLSERPPMRIHPNRSRC